MPESVLQDEWEAIARDMKVVRLTAPLGALVPALGIPALSKGTRGMTLYPGGIGLALGTTLMAASVAVGYLLLKPVGVAGPLLSAWVLGTAGAAVFVSALRPVAYVKPICVECRLLPVIKEHEAIHLTGVGSEGAVWESMRTRHSVESLGLEGDPAICPFCPIPRRLSEH